MLAFVTLIPNGPNGDMSTTPSRWRREIDWRELSLTCCQSRVGVNLSRGRILTPREQSSNTLE